MFDLDLFFYFEILAYLLGLSATLALASAIYLKWQRKPPSLPLAPEKRPLAELNPEDLSARLKIWKNFGISPNSNLWPPIDRFLGQVLDIGRALWPRNERPVHIDWLQINTKIVERC